MRFSWFDGRSIVGVNPPIRNYAYISDLCVGTAAVVGRAGLRSVARGDLVVPGHRTEWGSRSFAVAGPSCWNKLPVGLRDFSVGPETFARRLKTHLFRVGFSD